MGKSIINAIIDEVPEGNMSTQDKKDKVVYHTGVSKGSGKPQKSSFMSMDYKNSTSEK